MEIIWTFGGLNTLAFVETSKLSLNIIDKDGVEGKKRTEMPSEAEL